MASTLLAGCALGTAAIYVVAFSAQGVPFGWPMIQRFFLIGGGAEIYGRFSFSRLINFPLGFLNNLLATLPDSYAGLRSLLARPDKFVWLARIAFSGAVVFVPLTILLVSGLRSYSSWPSARKWATLSGIAAVAVIFWPLLYWDPMYDKLWLLPFAMLAAGLALTLANRNEFTSRATLLFLALFAAVEIPTNLYPAIASSRSPTEGLAEATQLMNIVSPADGIVLDFDKVSTLYIGYAGDENAVMLPAMSRATAKPAVDGLSAKCLARHGKLYFMEVLDENENTWNSFMGSRAGIPYHSFDNYRMNSTIVRRFPLNGTQLTLRVYDPPK
jgi:hypothetical protein